MNRLQKICLVVIALELVGVVLSLRWRSTLVRLPRIDWSMSMIEETTANEIRQMEQRVKRGDPASWMELAESYRAFGLFPQAEYCYRQIDRLSPKDAVYMYQWAECLDLLGETRDASKRYEQVAARSQGDPANASMQQYCWLNIGQDRLREADVKGAEEALRRVNGLPKAKLMLSRLLIRSGRAEEATKLLDELLREFPDTIDFNQMKSWAETELGHEDTALRFQDLELRSSKTMERWDPAHHEVQRRRDDMSSLAWHRKSIELEAKGQSVEALEWSRKAVQAFWAEDRVQQLARLELKAGHVQQAIALAEDCVKRVGASAATLDILGVSWVKLNDYARARQAWEQAAQIEPTPNLYAKLAELHRLAGNPEQARQYQALEQYQAGKTGWLRNDLKAARMYLEQAVLLDANHAHAWYYLAETRRLQGDSGGAERAYARCLQINPDHGRALRALDRLRQSTDRSKLN